MVFRDILHLAALTPAIGMLPVDNVVTYQHAEKVILIPLNNLLYKFSCIVAVQYLR